MVIEELGVDVAAVIDVFSRRVVGGPYLGAKPLAPDQGGEDRDRVAILRTAVAVKGMQQLLVHELIYVNTCERLLKNI